MNATFPPVLFLPFCHPAILWGVLEYELLRRIVEDHWGGYTWTCTEGVGTCSYEHELYEHGIRGGPAIENKLC